MSKPTNVDDWESVETAEDFVTYLALLSQDFDADDREVRQRWDGGEQYAEGRWAHSKTGDFLERWSSWLESARQPGSQSHAEIETVSWRSVAFQLWVASSYE